MAGRGEKMLKLALESILKEAPLQDFGNVSGVGQEVNDAIIGDGSNVLPASTSGIIASASLSSSSSSSSCSSSSSSESSSEDCDDIVGDTTYIPQEDSASDSDVIERDEHPRVHTVDASVVLESGATSTSSTLSSNKRGSSLTGTGTILTSPLKKGVKRKRNVEKWRRNIFKDARNSGKEYEMRTKDKRIREERKIKPACSDKCRLKCSTKFSEEERSNLFSGYWALGNIEKQRQFIKNSMREIKPTYRYVRVGGTRPQRKNNMAFYFQQNNKPLRVCKLFFMNTLDINSRPIRTVVEKQNKIANVLMEEDKRGKHGKQPKIDESVKEGIRQFIDSIPKIESHYTRANTSKHFIDGSKTISEIHKDYVAHCRDNNVEYGNYTLFYRLFTTEFNISFFVPKKDQCGLCTAYKNAEDEGKKHLEEKYIQHLAEKELSRTEKRADKEMASEDTVVAVYDLQAVMQLPKGDVSLFYYKSKLNVLNFTIYNLRCNSCECYVWDESNGHRGVNELATCVLRYMKEKADKNNEKSFIFYSDNCARQQKNKFMIAAYLYAVQFLNVRSVTHKYLVTGHTQNEGDSAHSLIERNVKRLLKSGPIYAPETFISAIRTARKTGEPFHVNEMCYDDFRDVKQLQMDIGPINMGAVKISDVKVFKVVKESPCSIFYKLSYSDTNFQEATVIKKKKRSSNNHVKMTPAFTAKPGISERKKDDLIDLVHKKLIPKFYEHFYNSL